MLVAPVGAALWVLLVEVTLGVVPSRRRPDENKQGARLRTAILMPAHNEARGIPAIISALAPALNDDMRLLVVADNCSDDTAAVARGLGADVVERQDTDRRGKGYALAYGRDALAGDPPECVIVLDADCEVEDDALTQLAQAAVEYGVPVQSCYLMRPQPDGAAMVQISNFAFLVKNLVRQRGAARLGAPAVLGGTGMAFPWTIFSTAPLASGDLVEDLALGIEMTRKGHTPRFLEHARTWSRAASGEDTLEQRTRWEHGFIDTARRTAIPLLGEAVRTGSPRRLWLALNLCVPPLALLMMVAVGVWGVAAILWLLGASEIPLITLSLLLGASGLALVAAWAVNGRQMLRGAMLLRIPLYIAWKLPVYLKLVRAPETQWKRTGRGD
ncbi:cellulose synthase/poly-beta-1,6-N-acetylglucosamine synthase-like glycosyltransferase [Sphingobium subterraneum]|uniref:Cellulose synthase/poly-beta-1,6-N-acetylglucosamine synthase-like glycosyltransferase n=2 Tax=Sphingobium subterraneum TaxID=627688 RepID=A0A841IWE0_9SPHN|nr:cellulose synthase/poly-beta-1,6-N-acetylglucosamine synthase-like glycosyltransferase [Sphingobium subterraneum]